MASNFCCRHSSAQLVVLLQALVKEDSEASMNRREWTLCDQFDAKSDFQVSGCYGEW